MFKIIFTINGLRGYLNYLCTKINFFCRFRKNGTRLEFRFRPYTVTGRALKLGFSDCTTLFLKTKRPRMGQFVF